MASKDINHELENYTDREILAEYEYRRLGQPYSDEIMITGFSEDTLLNELFRRDLQLPDKNVSRLLEDSIRNDLSQMADNIRNFIYNATGKFFKVEIA